MVPILVLLFCIAPGTEQCEGVNASFEKKLNHLEDIEQLNERTKKYSYFIIVNKILKTKAKKVMVF